MKTNRYERGQRAQVVATEQFPDFETNRYERSRRAQVVATGHSLTPLNPLNPLFPDL